MSKSLASIFLGTFVLEDLALAAAVALVAQGQLTAWLAFAACFFGISCGDLGLYLIGLCASRFGFMTRFAAIGHSAVLTNSIVVSRFIPGTRLATYVTAGFLGYPIFKFVVLTFLSVAVWVGIAVWGGQTLFTLFRGNWVAVVAVFLLMRSILPKLMNRWDRKAFYFSWRRWLHFEFWPATLFYLPIVPLYIFRSIKGRSFLLPFYANPQILNGGLIGESKWDFLKHLSLDDPATLKSTVFTAPNFTKRAEFSFPFILKPDVGQRGYGARLIRSEVELQEYLNLSSGSVVIAQALSQFSREAGIFYFRPPSAARGTIFSLTDKQFPFIVGDGKRALGDLILADARARVIASVYFARHRARLDDILPAGEHFILAECGNHCQGAIFLDGAALKSETLRARLDQIAAQVPDFHVGRIDVRYKNAAQLRAGLDFEIVEINGAGSEATHIWDPHMRLLEAYRVLFHQWRVLFAIGAEVKRQRTGNIRIWLFLRECLRVMRRKDGFSISS